MPRTLEQVVREQVGVLMMQIAQLTVELEAAQAKIQALEAAASPPKEAP